MRAGPFYQWLWDNRDHASDPSQGVAFSGLTEVLGGKRGERGERITWLGVSNTI